MVSRRTYYNERNITYHIRFKCRFVFPIQQLPPVDTVKECMSLDLRSAFCTESALRSSIKQLREEVLGRWWHYFWSREMQRFG